MKLVKGLGGMVQGVFKRGRMMVILVLWFGCTGVKLSVTATLSLAAACSSAGVMVLFTRDTNICKIDKKLSCDMYQISIAFAFASWFLLAMSSYVMFWLVASV
ncbi:hypothetical protein BUALT_Bualt06G0048600 [Buddleja alternifolia]|uniref:CASP-like protein n=1 Tax=Buddleja alternifolia TaxID=168488 RepID=A0AAV6XD12_9LAMI|nr:hypothetical protein BUALT_Bualt06G0048600 [Buddleja alternifolia]